MKKRKKPIIKPTGKGGLIMYNQWMKELTQIIGVSGDEKRVSRYLAKAYQGQCDKIVYDNLGSVFALKKSKKENANRVMVCAHMDEVGLMITEIQENGLLSFIKIGPIEEKALYGSRVRIQTREKEMVGVITADEDAMKNNDVKGMRIDIGASSKEEVQAQGIMAGDTAVMDGEYTMLHQNRIMAKAADARQGCVLGLVLLEALKGVELDFDLYVGASVMEEVGQRGGTTATGLIHPDLGIVLDGGAADDYKGKDNEVGQLGKGVLIRYYDKGMMPNRGLLEELEMVCKENKIDSQYYYTMALTDSAWVHKLFSGCPTLTLGVCSRNSHTGNAEIDLHDLECAGKALVEIVKGLNSEKIQKFKEYNR